MRKRYSSSLKLKVCIEVLKGDLTIAEIASRYEVPATLIPRWKKQLLEQGASVFEGSQKSTTSLNSSDSDKLHAKIGSLVVENDFLKRALLN